VVQCYSQCNLRSVFGAPREGCVGGVAFQVAEGAESGWGQAGAGRGCWGAEGDELKLVLEELDKVCKLSAVLELPMGCAMQFEVGTDNEVASGEDS